MKTRNSIRYGTRCKPFIVRQVEKITIGTVSHTALIIDANVLKLINSKCSDCSIFNAVIKPTVADGDVDPIILSDRTNHIKVYTDQYFTDATTDKIKDVAGVRKAIRLTLGRDELYNRAVVMK